MSFLNEYTKRKKLFEAEEDEIKRLRGQMPKDPEFDEDDIGQYSDMGPRDPETGEVARQRPQRLTVPVPGAEPDKQGNLPTQQLNIAAHSYKRLEYFVNRSYHLRNSPDGGALLIFGDPGLGKSQVVQQSVRRIAAADNRQFVDVSKISDYSDIEANPGNYFLYSDVRASQLQPFDLTGIPNIADTDKPYLQTKQFAWIYLFGLTGVAGVIFLDELGHAHPDVHNALFGLVLDRKVGNTSLSDGTFIVAASNLASEFDVGSGSNALPQPLINRFRITALVADPEEWIQYARKSGVDPLIISFVQHNPKTNFYLKPDAEKSPNDPFPTPRAIFRFSAELKEIKREYAQMKKTGRQPEVSIWDAIQEAAAQNCGYTWASDFDTYLNHYRQVNWDNYVESPELITKASGDQMQALKIKVARLVAKRDEAIYNQIVDVLRHAPIESVASMMTNIREHDSDAADLFFDWLTGGMFENPETARAWRNFIDPNDPDIPKDHMGNPSPDYEGSILGKVMDQLHSHESHYGV